MHTTANAPRAGGSPWTDPQLRAWLFQLLAVASVIAFGWYLFDNTQQNLAQRGIVSGFGFLDNNAGFGIAQHLIDYNESNSYGRVFVVGLLNTLLVSVIGILVWRGCRQTGFSASWPPSISKHSAISRRCCRYSSGISP